jgi:hypothetical protein
MTTVRRLSPPVAATFGHVVGTAVALATIATADTTLDLAFLVETMGLLAKTARAIS